MGAPSYTDNVTVLAPYAVIKEEVMVYFKILPIQKNEYIQV